MCDFAVNMCIKYVLYINICCFLGLYFSYRTTLHTRIANNPVFFDDSRKTGVGYLPDVIIYSKFYINLLRGIDSVRGWNLAVSHRKAWSLIVIWTKFGTDHKYNTINTPEWPNLHNVKVQNGGDRHLEFRENVNNSGLDKDIWTKFYRKMHHGHAEMTMWPKVEIGS